jgi:hypothetical protein
LFTQSSPVHKPLLQAFPFPSTLGEVTLHQISQVGVFIYSSCGKWAFPRPVEFSSHHHFYKLSCCWLLGVCCCSCLLWLACLFTITWGIAPPTLWCSGCPALFATCLFCCYCLLFSFFSFFPGWGSVCRGGYADLAQGCLWEYCVLLSSPCGLRLPKPSGCWCLVVAWESSWFLC